MEKKSQLLPLLFEGLSASRRVTVLNIGESAPETFEFFGRVQCRLRMANVFSEAEAASADDDFGKKRFRDVLGVTDDTHFDICLLWDFLSFLDDSTLAAFTEVLLPCLRDQSRAHAFLTFTPGKPMSHYRYAIKDVDRLSVNDAKPSRAPYSRTMRTLYRPLNMFRLEKSFLWEGNRRESLLMAIPDKLVNH